MVRLAWFTPLPPVRSGISAYSAELLSQFSGSYEIDVFVDPGSGALGTTPPQEVRRIASSREFVYRHARQPYDLTVYQLGNARCHDYMWAYVIRYPGLAVLHDGTLHHARAAQLLREGRSDDYRRELRYDQPLTPSDAAELATAGDESAFYYDWPLIRPVVSTARLSAVHNLALAVSLRERYPDTPIEAIRMGVADPFNSLAAAGGEGQGGGASGHQGMPTARPSLRHRLPEGPPQRGCRVGDPGGAVVFAAFGLVTREKRIMCILKALARLIREVPAGLMLVGPTVDHFDVFAEAQRLEVADHVILTGFVPDAELAAYLAAADVGLCLRWPTARETSGSWLRCLAAGKPTIVTALSHLSELPALDPRDEWSGSVVGDVGAPFGFRVDLLDEDETLLLAMRRLAVDVRLRQSMGRSARAYWLRHHTLSHMTSDYERAITAALGRSAPEVPDLPPHFREAGTSRAVGLLAHLGVETDLFMP